MTRADVRWLLAQSRVYAAFWLYAVPSAAVVYGAAVVLGREAP